jgi:hypothetical protein
MSSELSQVERLERNVEQILYRIDDLLHDYDNYNNFDNDAVQLTRLYLREAILLYVSPNSFLRKEYEKISVEK